MTKLYTPFVILIATSFFATSAQAQFNPGLASTFAVDGDLYSNQRLSGLFNATSTDDWFFKSQPLNTGRGIIDTTGAAQFTASLSSGYNPNISLGMAYPRYSVQGAKLMMDARYARDNIGLSGQLKDSTVYTNGAKNGMAPANWGSNPSGSSVIDKTDIVDGFAHIRRDGTIVAGSNPDHLVLVMGASTLGTNGVRFIDLELYKSRISYDGNSGIFSNSGPSISGGHSVWNFNAAGNIIETGDMDFTFDFSSSEVSDIAVYIWVAKTTVENVIPAGFDFVGITEFHGDGQNAEYGYAKIIPKNGAALPVWASVNTSETPGPFWGTHSKDIGQVSSNYYSASYAAGQFAEVGIDLTEIGFDVMGFSNACSSPFSRMMIKSRSSSSFTSALSDFTGPYDFLDAPVIPPTILNPGNLKCNVSTVKLEAQTVVSGAMYTWSTMNGNMITDPNNSFVIADKVGKYFLTTSPAPGCLQQVDSVIITKDENKPVASANRTGIIGGISIVMVKGGDESASNYNTPFGESSGLEWKWEGPSLFTSSLKDNVVTNEGMYTLVITEMRNGCKDTATVYVPAGATLSVKVTDFSGKNQNGSDHLSWTSLNESSVSRYEVESGNDGILFAKVGEVVATSNSASFHNYSFVQHNVNNKLNFYRLKVINTDGTFFYSKTISLSNNFNASQLSAYPVPFSSKINVVIKSNKTEVVLFRIINNEGKIISVQSATLNNGMNNISFTGLEKNAPGKYYIEMKNAEGTVRMGVVK